MSHVLSAKSVALGRDTFIFTSLNPLPARLVLGVNQKLTPVSSATVQRWIRTISPETSRELFICPVNVHSVGIFEYWIEPHGSSIDGTSESSLPPGEYGLYYNRNARHCHERLVSYVPMAGECTSGGFRDIMALPRKWNDTFEYQANHVLDEEERISEYCFSPSITQLVVARDNQCCRFTGRTGDIALSWIFPPVFREQTKASWFDLLDKDFFSPANVLTMHTNLKFHFHSNHFTVDVDGDYRIIILRDMGEAMSLLPAHFPTHHTHNATLDAFLRDHFKFSIATMLLGGDIRETYGPRQIKQAMTELGFDDDGDEYILPFSHEHWQTEIGQEILGSIIRRRALFDSPSESVGSSGSPGTKSPEDIDLSKIC